MCRTLFSDYLQGSPPLETALRARFLPVGLGDEGVIGERKMSVDCVGRSLGEASLRATSRLPSNLPLIPQKKELHARPTRETQPETRPLTDNAEIFQSAGPQH